MTRITKMGRKTHLEATPYDRPETRPSPEISSPLTTTTTTKERKALPSQEAMEVSMGVKARRSEHRRQKREQSRNAGKVCFKCREEGHRAQDCPQGAGDTGSESTPGGSSKSQKQICYRCGKSDHSLKQCRLHPSRGLPFAECFVCKEKGHITSNCPENGKGIYPDGGSCKICRSVEHLAKDCPIPDEVRLGTVVGSSSNGTNIGADDDDFHDVAKVELTRGKGANVPLVKRTNKVVAF